MLNIDFATTLFLNQLHFHQSVSPNVYYTFEYKFVPKSCLTTTSPLFVCSTRTKISQKEKRKSNSKLIIWTIDHIDDDNNISLSNETILLFNENDQN